jgi:hypothetical protein
MAHMNIETFTENGFEESKLEYQETGETGYSIDSGSFKEEFEKHFNVDKASYNEELFSSDKVCFKTKINSIQHPFEFKTEWDWVIIEIPFNGTIKEKVRPRLYRRNAEYTVYAEICYPIDLIIDHVERCAKQGAIAAAAIALTGNIGATQVAFQTAFFACMALADFPNADKITIRVFGDVETGDWIPV